ncbi:hypothetical protein KTC77_28035, partial [Klebsiella pneumoniae]|nr:hypothetical protein [Klebsiella pneumoniae]
MKTKSIIFTAALLLTGCASQSQVDQLTKQVNTLKTDCTTYRFNSVMIHRHFSAKYRNRAPSGFAILTANPTHKERLLLAAFVPAMALSSMANLQKFHGRFI